MRASRYALLQGFFHGADDSHEDAIEGAQIHLRAVSLGAEAPCAGRALGDLDLGEARVSAVVRQGRRFVDPGADLLLQAGDTVVLAGTLQQIGEAQARLEGR